MFETDLEKNTEFRIKWYRGEMGSLCRFGAIYVNRGFI